MNDQDWMQLALEQAEQAVRQGEVPVGAVVVDPQGKLLAVAHNQVITRQDPTAHAEILALRAAATKLGNYRLNQCQLFVTLEPCSMCAGAMVHARIQRLVFGTRDWQAGAAGSILNGFADRGLNHRVLIDEGIRQQECAQILSSFFLVRRGERQP